MWISARCFFLFTFLVTLSSKSYSFDHSHEQWTKLLETYVDQAGLVDYESWKLSPNQLDDYLDQLSKVPYPSYQKWSKFEKRAFLINAYNAFTIKLILDNYPVKSIRKIGGFFQSPWEIKFFSILDGQIKSLDPIEHEWLRVKPELFDPRVHAAVNCASISCPKLARTAYTASNLNQQLDKAMKTWMSDPSRNKFSKGSAKLSKIYDWFEKDFGKSDKQALQFALNFLPEQIKALLGPDPDIDYLDYDWNLNKKP